MAAEFKIGRLRYNWAGAWSPNTVYARDNVVQYQGQAYVCLVPNTSNANFYADLYASPYPCWSLMTVGHTFAGTWGSNTLYSLNNLVIFDGTVYQCTTAHTSSVFSTDIANWSVYVQEATWQGSWTTSTTYGVGALVTYGGITYKCITAHVSSASVSSGLEANQSAWTVWYNGVAYLGNWQASYRYKANDLVKVDADIYICTTYHTSSSTLSSLNFTLWLPGQDFSLVWSASTTYQIGDAIVYGGNAYISKTANNLNNVPSTSTLNWSLFNQGFSIQGAWSGISGKTYSVGSVVTRNGNVYEALVDNTQQDPAGFSVTYTYQTTGSSGTSLVINGSQSLVTGMIVSGTGVTNGQIVMSSSTSTATSTAITISGTALTIGGTITGTFAVGMLLSTSTGVSAGTIITSIGTTNGGAGVYTINNSQTVSSSVSVTGTVNTVTLDRVPNAALINGQTLSFTGVNSAYWTLLIPGKKWLNTWVNNFSYTIGDTVLWASSTYYCIQNHLSIASTGILNGVVTTSGNRPDLDATNTYWAIYIAGNLNNAINTVGDLPTYTKGPSNYALPIGTNTYNLRVNGNVPAWQKINVLQAVYYVDTYNGVDLPSYGLTWDQPWKTIKYACNFVGQGTYYANATAALVANKAWMITEMYQWMLYQANNNISPYSTTSLFDPFYTQRDAGYIIDAVIYDMRRGGNSQTVAAVLRYFYYGSNTKIINSLTESVIQYIYTSLTYLTSLMQNAATNTPPTASYQVLNGITANSISYVSQSFTGLIAESGTSSSVASLMNIIISALTSQNASLVPSSNSGITAIINIKTGTYSEILPIVVPENVSIVGDELRSVTVQPTTSISFYATGTNGLTNVITTTGTTGLTDQMPIQFISPYINNATTSFEANIIPGQTYYVLGSSITANSFKIVNSPTITFTGTTVSGSAVVMNASQITSLKVGMNVTGAGIPTGTTIVSFAQAISSLATVTLSQPATASGILQTFTATGSVVTLTGGFGNMLFYAGDCLKDMWYMTNGTTMRNLTNTGLLGQLSQTDAYSLARPTGGNYVSFNPGTGPDDTSVWIIRKSPYLQNITQFGTGCVGYKVDGTLHNGGNKAMVSNDFTQVLSDGIGLWVTGSGAITEAISVFCYYNYVGYFAEAGGRIRSANGNSSYGTYGVVSEGYDVNEIPATGNIFNQSTQVQASVAQAFGTIANILKLNYSNAGSGYFLPATNMLRYSNNFVAGVWTSDGNVSFIKNEIAPTGYTEAWLLTGSQNTPATGYIQQNISVNPSGAFYSAVSGTTQNSAPGAGATFDITITATAYTAVVHAGSPGSYYAVSNTILIKGSQLGGVDGTNDCIITVASLTGTGILSINAPIGVVPVGSAQLYTLSMYVYPGSSNTIDLQGVFSGSSTVVSGISYNVTTNVVTPYAGIALGNSTTAGMTPIYYGALKTLVPGWYRVWVSVYDINGLNNTLTYKFFTQGANAPTTGQYSIIYGAQTELSGVAPPPDFYLETTSSMYTAYSNFEVVGAGSGALLSGDETRSGSVFNARITTDTAGYTGGNGYVTSSNTAQAGNSYSIQISNADPGLSNYLGMRIFIQSGTGAGQYGYITYYNNSAITVNGVASKTALICQDEVDQISIITTTYSATAANNLLTIASGTDLSKVYVNQPVQFIPTYFTSVVTSAAVAQVTAVATQGGTVNVIQLTSVSNLAANMIVTFIGSGFNITSGYNYYILQINPTINGTLYNNCIQISATLYGTAVQLSTVATNANVTMIMNYPSYTGYLTANGTSTILNVTGITSTSGVFSGTGFNLTAGQQVTITGIFSYGAISGYVEGATYYVIGNPTSTAFQLSASYNGSNITTTVSAGTITGITVTAYSITTANMLSNIAIQFTGVSLGGVTLGANYYIQDIIDSNNFTVSTQQTNLTSTSTVGGTTNTIQATTSSLIPLNPVVFSGTLFDASLTANTTYYISSIVDSNDFTIASSIYRTTITSTTYSTNIIQVTGPVTNFVQYQPIIFSGIAPGTTFGNIAPETVYYILTINTSLNQIVISTDKINPFPLTSATGVVYARTCLSTSAVVLGGGTGSMTVTSTGSKVMVTNSIATTGTMNATFQTSLIGGLNSYTVYYITAINPGATPTISVATSLGGTPVTLVNGLGNMQMAASGWDNINPGTPSVTLDSTSSYFIEPRAIFSSPSWSQVSGTMLSPLANGVNWQGIAYGNNYFLAIPSTGVSGAVSSNGVNWTSMVLPAGVATWTSIAFGNYYWIALGTTAGGVSVAAYSNSNGTGWRTNNLPSTNLWSQVVYGNGRFTAITSNSTSVAYTTNFGSTWSSSYLPSNHTFTVTGNAQISTTQQKIGSSSLYLDGTANTYISSVSSTDYAFGTGDFTIELWIYRIGNAGANQLIIDFRPSGSASVSPVIYLNTSYVPVLLVNGTVVITGSAAVALNTWTHIALQRSSGSTILFVNGAQSGSTYTDSNSYIQGPITVGANQSGAAQFTGYIDELRIEKGLAKYTPGGFTPSTTAYTPDSNSIVLLHFEGNNTSTSVLNSTISGTIVGFAYGTGIFLAITSTGAGMWSYDGIIWQSTTLPASTGTLLVTSITGGQGTFQCTTSTNQLVIGQTVIISGANVGSGIVTNGTYYIIATNGKTQFTLGATPSSGTGITTTSGNPNGLVFTLGPANYSGLTWGDNRFVAIQNSTGLYPAYSFDGITWYQSLTYMSATSVVYGNGRFVAVSSSNTTEYNSHAAVYWTQRTLTYGSINAIGYGFNSSNVGVFPTLAGTGSAGQVSAIYEGTRAQGRATVTSGTITAVTLFETGSNYSSSPTLTFVDFNSQVTARINPRIGNGALSNPTFVNRGSGYNTTSTQVTITGNGYADTYQTGYTLIINNLPTLPLVGSNLSIAGNSTVYKVTSATAVYGTTAPFIEANVQISPSMTTALSPSNGTTISLRQLYSQCRLTNHDFLSVGSGNAITSNYPNINQVNAIISNESIELNQGHVFWTSTDESGNFAVGGLFGVQQATGTVTLSATQFGLQGLQTLSLGGIAVGGSSVVVTQFSTDPTFVANSDAIIPTQKSIKSYLTGRLSQGGSNTYTGTLIAGTVDVGGANFIKSTVANGQSGSTVKMVQKVYINATGVDGGMAALDFFMRNNSHRSTSQF
jgi:hypothetical protein